ncbi:MAG: sigma-70 family RNA polymerase sigma factor [Pseudomonadota bacterium]
MSHDDDDFSPPSTPGEVSDYTDSRGAEREELTHLYKSFAPFLTNALRKSFGDGPPDPEDAAQQAFERMLERTDLSAIRDVKAFLWGTARNFMLTGNRSVRVAAKYQQDVEQRFFAPQSYGTDPQRVINAGEIVGLINAALMNMPLRRRRAFYLRRVEGLPVREIAQRLGISSAAVSKHVAIASAELDVLLADEND